MGQESYSCQSVGFRGLIASASLKRRGQVDSAFSINGMDSEA